MNSVHNKEIMPRESTRIVVERAVMLSKESSSRWRDDDESPIDRDIRRDNPLPDEQSALHRKLLR